MSWLYSIRFHLILALSLCVAGALALWWFITNHEHAWWRWIAVWLVSVNVVTLAYYGIDKLLAMRSAIRIPEIVLHTLGAIGGSPAALLGMWLFRHKTIKTSFRIFFWIIVVLQVSFAIWLLVTML
jgi:uncharacterized membrane protein YsdA (DUF1294 family)